MQLSLPTLVALLPFFLSGTNAQSAGVTTRYWDCCKASCGWPGKLTLASGSNPVTSCDKSDNPITDYNAVSVCNGGSASMCSSQSPWAVSSTLAYGFAATHISGGTEASWCCACYALTFTSGPVAGKTMIVQSTNTGGDLGSNQFDIAMPGGGFGIYDGCTSEWGTPSTGWGAQYGGVTTRSQCDAFPAHLQPGCYWRFDWFMNADNPTVSFTQVACPAALTAKSGCVRANDSINESPTGPAVVPTWTSGAAASSSTKVSTTSTSSSKPPTTSSSSSSSSSSKPSTTTTTTSKVSGTTTSSSAASTNTLPPVVRWGQCGGLTYSGSTVCVSPWVCTYSSPYYSQCL